MNHGGDFEKQVSEVDVDAHHVSASRRTSVDKALEETLDAEANIEPPITLDTTAEKSNDPGPPPNGGFDAWLQVAGSFFLFFNGWYVNVQGTILSRSSMTCLTLDRGNRSRVDCQNSKFHVEA